MRGLVLASLVGMALGLSATLPVRAQETKGTELTPSPDNLVLTWQRAGVVLPAGMAGGTVWQGVLRHVPSVSGRSPVVIFMHGSSGLAPFVGEYQRWLAESLGLPSIAPDSMAIPDRLTYKSPVAVDLYERVHALRLAELENALAQAVTLPWVDPGKIVVAGTSEGGVPVARLAGKQPAARLIYAWTCEANYFVDQPKTAIPLETPVLTMIAARDPYFSPENPWNKGFTVRGTCSDALKAHQDATNVLLASDKHTIINTPQARDMAAAFLKRVLGQ